MDFSNILSKEINKRKKQSHKSSSKSKRAKHNTDEVKRQDHTIEKQDEEVDSAKGLDKHAIGDFSPNDEFFLANPKKDGLSEAQIDEKLKQYNEYDSSLSKDDKSKRLQFLLQLDLRNKKYKDWLDQEDPFYQDPSKQTVVLDSIIEAGQNRHRLRIQIRVYLKEIIREWESQLDESDEDALLLKETKKGIVNLLYKLRSDKLPTEALVSLSTIVYYLQSNQFNKANESYMKLSIGNVCWPIGVVNVGIHARSSSSKITGSKNVSNIMMNELTRKWIISVKRLINFKEKQYNNRKGQP
ncbi:Prp18 protein [Candida orthopsilosis Co 90-125]|uniref:Pre-mRNA-splicing factor 18 n=1 Tax=Candida orthopsilosis (strain 90-125) TaxID=1136231 RepID=H8WZ42_CANO9|nr:Prp18 protein [Candida orthopsilosis Co 90-125]CCG21674.1 Prp18 protein [Candida orthopsilosis Co 90-125]